MSVTTLEENTAPALFPFIKACHSVTSRQDFMLSVYPKLWKLLPHDMFAGVIVDANSLRVRYCFNHSFPKSYLERVVTSSGVLECPVLKQWIEKARPVYFDLSAATASALDPIWMQTAEIYGMRNIAAHGIRSGDNTQVSYFTFAGIYRWEPAHIFRLQLIIPHLYVAMTSCSLVLMERCAPRYNILHASVCADDNRSPPLSQRELEVLRWISYGKSNDETAMILGISPWTVKTHVKHVMSKLDVTRRGQAIAKAFKLRLIS